MKALGEPKKKQEQGDIYSPIQAYAILRFSQAIAMSRTFLKSAEKDPLLTKVLHRGLYSYFRDCQDEGVGEEAKLLLKTFSSTDHAEVAVNKSVLTPQTS